MGEHSGHQADWEDMHVDELPHLAKFAIDHAPDAVYWISEDARIIYVNQAACESLGYSREELLRMTIPEIDPTWSVDKWHDMWSIFREHGSATFETVHKSKQGKIFPVEIRVNFIEYGGRSFHCAYARDISRRKKTVETLRLIQYALDNISDGALLISSDGRFVQVNRAACALLGYSEEELLKMSVSDINPDFLPDIWPAHWEEVRKERLATLEGVLKTKSGQFIPVEIHANFVEFEGKEYHYTFFRDISERKKAEQALRESSQMLKLVLDTIPVPVFWKDRNSVYLGCNYIFFIYTGLSPQDEIIGKTDLDMPWKNDEAERYRADDREVMETGVPKLGYEETQRKPDGQIAWLRTSKVPLRSFDGSIIGVLGSFEDITDSKRSEEALRKANRTLVALSRVNEILVRATEESELLRDVCQAIVDLGEYRMAWVGFAEYDEERTVHPAAHAGYEADYLHKIRVSWGDNELGHGPAGIAIRTGKLHVVHDLNSEPSFQPWREEAIKRGYECAISIPLTTDGQTLGAITLYGPQPDCLEPEEEKLLTQLASDLTYGIVSLRTRKERQAVEAERRMFEQRLEEQKRKFFRETILSVTDGKLSICDAADVKPYISNAQVKIDLNEISDIGPARREVEAFYCRQGLSSEELGSFIAGVGEAITNAIKHGIRGRVYAGKTEDEIWAAVKDRGSGIESLILPRAVLRRGFSTKPSLGIGYSIMLDVADRILLKTGVTGTTVVLIKSLGKTTVPFGALLDLWEENLRELEAPA